MTPPAILSEEPHGLLLLGGYLFHSAAEQQRESKVPNRLIEVNRSVSCLARGDQLASVIRFAYFAPSHSFPSGHPGSRLRLCRG